MIHHNVFSCNCMLRKNVQLSCCLQHKAASYILWNLTACIMA